MKEIILSGGNTSGEVVRIGNTVRKQTTETSATVHRLLRHLEEKSIPFVPRFLGIDEFGRESLSYIQGATGIPTFIWESDDCLQKTAAMLRQFHDASLDFENKDTDNWRMSFPDKAHHEVICHNDFAPYNTVYKNTTPVGVFDFDLAGPGPRLKDIAYAAYWNVPLSFGDTDNKVYSEKDLDENCRRLKLFCAAYGIDCNADLVNQVSDVLELMGNEKAIAQILGKETTVKLKVEGHLNHWQKEKIAFDTQKQAILNTI